MTPSVLSSDFSNLFAHIAENSGRHSRDSDWYKELSQLISERFLPSLTGAMQAGRPFKLGEIGVLNFPWVSFGSIDSSHLFGLDELILFSFYWSNRSRFTQFLDLGANVGLHSLVALKLGWSVTSVEPDPVHFEFLERILEESGIANYNLVKGAATVSSGSQTFLRVEGNTTGSHLKGAKKNPYGPLTEFEVEGYPVTKLVVGKDLVKMDVEGLEGDLMESLFSEGYQGFDVFLEIGSASAAQELWETAKEAGVNVFTQKTNWCIATDQAELPCHHSEGSAFISRSEAMTWA